jgi:hypothetical protein
MTISCPELCEAAGLGEHTRLAYRFPRLAENTGRNENVQAFRAVSRATAERGARSATPEGGCAPRAGRQGRGAATTITDRVRCTRSSLGEHTRPACGFPRLAENTGRNETFERSEQCRAQQRNAGRVPLHPGAGVLPGQADRAVARPLPPRTESNAKEQSRGSTRAPRVVFRASRKTPGATKRSSVPGRVARNSETRGAFRYTRRRVCSPGRQTGPRRGHYHHGQSPMPRSRLGEHTRPACRFPRLAENTGRNENVRAFRAVSRATAERGARSATPGGGCAPRARAARRRPNSQAGRLRYDLPAQ